MQKLTPHITVWMVVLLLPVFSVASPNRIVLGYSATWRDTVTPAECYNYDAITHIARAFLAPHPDGTVEVPEGYFNQSMESLARKHGVKLLMSLGGEASNADNWLSIARNPQYLQRFEESLSNLLAAHGYDGIDIDWEPSALTTEDGAAYVTLLKALRTRFPDRILTTALGASEYWIGHFSWKEVTENVDFVNVMTYDYSGGWGGRAAYCSNLFPAGAYPPEPTLSVAEGMQNLIENHKVPPAKLLLGITFWPSRFSVDHIGDRFPVNGPGYSMNISYAQAISLLRTGRYRDFWDEKAAMPYMERIPGGSVVCYENFKSVLLKCQYAAKPGCAGVMIWHLGADVDGISAPLMDAVAESCGAPRQMFPPAIIDRQAADFKDALHQLPSAAPNPSASSADPFIELENTWAFAQDQAWQQNEPQHKAK